MLNASSSDELPKGFGESLAERIELDSPKDRQKQLRVTVTGQKRLAELPPGQLSRIERQTAGLGFRLQGLMQAQKWLPSCREYEDVFPLRCATDWLSGIPECS